MYELSILGFVWISTLGLVWSTFNHTHRVEIGDIETSDIFVEVFIIMIF